MCLVQKPRVLQNRPGLELMGLWHGLLDEFWHSPAERVKFDRFWHVQQLCMTMRTASIQPLASSSTAAVGTSPHIRDLGDLDTL